jgi:hypothetical protein
VENTSYLGTKIARIGNVLRKTATSTINEYQKRLRDANRLSEPLFRDLIVDTIDKKQARKTAADFFGKELIKFVAIDGTEYSRPLYDMIVFFAATEPLWSHCSIYGLGVNGVPIGINDLAIARHRLEKNRAIVGE